MIEVKKKVTALILNWNSSYDSISLYKELKEYISSQEIELKIWVIDNDSEPTDQKELKNNIENDSLIFTGKNLGYAGGNNVGIKKAVSEDADYVVILNPDIKIQSDIITPLVKILSEDTEIGVIGPRICFKENPEMIYSDGGILNIEDCYSTGHHNWKQSEKGIDTSLKEVDYVNGSAMVIPIQSFRDFGVLLESFFLYFEETEWCLRLKNNGRKVIVCPSVKVLHQSSVKGSSYHFYMSRNRIWLAKINKVNFRATRNKYFKKYLFSFLKLKPFSWSKFKGSVCGVIFNPNKG